MEKRKDSSLLNCLATGMLAYFITVPGHEFLHFLTDVIYGSRHIIYSAGAVLAVDGFDYSKLSTFDKVMVAGGSASILNAIFGIILIFILLKVKMGAKMRVFLTQLMGGQLVQGIGYFMIGGLFSAGDWGNVFKIFADEQGFCTALHIILSVVGCAGVVGIFFILNYMSYYFIEDVTDKKEKLSVSFKLHLIMTILGFFIGLIISMMSPAYASGELDIMLGLLYSFMWIPFFWAFMFTGVMNVFPPKQSRFLYRLPEKADYLLLSVAVILILIDIFIFGPGITVTL